MKTVKITSKDFLTKRTSRNVEYIIDNNIKAVKYSKDIDCENNWTIEMLNIYYLAFDCTVIGYRATKKGVLNFAKNAFLNSELTNHQSMRYVKLEEIK